MDTMTLINNGYSPIIIDEKKAIFKLKNLKKCWYCDSFCQTFISICSTCKEDRRYKKQKNKKLIVI